MTYFVHQILNNLKSFEISPNFNSVFLSKQQKFSKVSFETSEEKKKDIGM